MFFFLLLLEFDYHIFSLIRTNIEVPSLVKSLIFRGSYYLRVDLTAKKAGALGLGITRILCHSQSGMWIDGANKSL